MPVGEDGRPFVDGWLRVAGCLESKFYGAFVLNHRVAPCAIDAPEALVDFHTALDARRGGREVFPVLGRFHSFRVHEYRVLDEERAPVLCAHDIVVRVHEILDRQVVI